MRRAKIYPEKLKGSSKYPNKWNSTFCARFVLDAVELMEKDIRMRDSNKTTQKSQRKKAHSTGSLPPAAVALITMVQEARIKVQNEHAPTKKRKAGRVKTVQGLLLKNTAHNPEFVEVTADMILQNIQC